MGFFFCFLSIFIRTPPPIVSVFFFFPLNFVNVLSRRSVAFRPRRTRRAAARPFNYYNINITRPDEPCGIIVPLFTYFILLLPTTIDDNIWTVIIIVLYRVSELVSVYFSFGFDYLTADVNPPGSVGPKSKPSVR